MKIKTKGELQDKIDEDLSWRKKELSNLYNNVKVANPKILPMSLRCAVVLLYAHWEGFIKGAAESYLVFIKSQKLKLNEVNPSILALSLKQKFKEFSETNKATLHVQFIEYLKNNLHEKASFSETDSIKTNSNLSSTILEEILCTIGIDFTPYELKSNLIDSKLLKYRNSIAHGNYLLLDINEYENLHLEVLTLLDSIATDICNACFLDKFKA